MRGITIDEGLTIRFPGRSADFTAGVEIGLLAALMGLGHEEIARPIARANLTQARALAQAFGYRLIELDGSDAEVRVVLTRRKRPTLRLVVG